MVPTEPETLSVFHRVHDHVQGDIRKGLPLSYVTGVVSNCVNIRRYRFPDVTADRPLIAKKNG